MKPFHGFVTLSKICHDKVGNGWKMGLLVFGAIFGSYIADDWRELNIFLLMLKSFSAPLTPEKRVLRAAKTFNKLLLSSSQVLYSRSQVEKSF